MSTTTQETPPKEEEEVHEEFMERANQSFWGRLARIATATVNVVKGIFKTASKAVVETTKWAGRQVGKGVGWLTRSGWSGLKTGARSGAKFASWGISKVVHLFSLGAEAVFVSLVWLGNLSVVAVSGLGNVILWMFLAVCHLVVFVLLALLSPWTAITSRESLKSEWRNFFISLKPRYFHIVSPSLAAEAAVLDPQHESTRAAGSGKVRRSSSAKKQGTSAQRSTKPRKPRKTTAAVQT